MLEALTGMDSGAFSPLASGLGVGGFAVGAVPADTLGVGASPRRAARHGSASGATTSSITARQDGSRLLGRQQSRLGAPTHEPPLIDLGADEQQQQQEQQSNFVWAWGGAVDTDRLAQAPCQQEPQQRAEDGRRGSGAPPPQQHQQQEQPAHLLRGEGPAGAPPPVTSAGPAAEASNSEGHDAGDMDHDHDPGRGQGADHDLRSSWGSDRSAEVTQPWETMRTVLPPEGSCLRRPSSGGRTASVGGAAGLRQSTESLASLDGPACSEREASILPLRTALHGSGASDASQLSSPAPTPGATPGRRLLGFSRSAAPGSAPRRSCFSCASPFGACRGGPGDDAGDEVVRRNVGASSSASEFVIRSKSLPSSADKEEPHSGGHKGLRKEGLNQPPPSPGERMLVGRQSGFSGRCGRGPGAWSPAPGAAPGDDGASPAASGSSPTTAAVGHGVEEMLSALKSSEAPSVDMLNDMLKAFCSVENHPRDAEDLVAEACKRGGVVPNAATMRTLDQIWAAHEQLHG
eukprot:scaffold21.g2150.t1